jgi:hypothetical protein
VPKKAGHPQESVSTGKPLRYCDSSKGKPRWLSTPSPNKRHVRKYKKVTKQTEHGVGLSFCARRCVRESGSEALSRVFAPTSFWPHHDEAFFKLHEVELAICFAQPPDIPLFPKLQKPR